MGFADLIASGVGIANQLTNDLQDQTVTFAPWIGEVGDGTPSYAVAQPMPALVDLSAQPVFAKDGTAILSKAKVTFLYPIPDTVTSNDPGGHPFKRINPIDPRDMIILPDGTTGPIVAIEGFVNATTHRPFLSSVTLGK